MGRKCTVCEHDSLNQIDEQLISGQPALRIANRFGLKEKAVRNHKDKHLPTRLVQAHKLKEMHNADGLLLRAEAIFQKAWALSKTAEDEKSYAASVSALKECRSCLELTGKLLGELRSGVTINLLYSPEWATLRTILWEVLDRYPEVKQDVIGAISDAIDVDYEELDTNVNKELPAPPRHK